MHELDYYRLASDYNLLLFSWQPAFFCFIFSISQTCICTWRNN